MSYPVVVECTGKRRKYVKWQLKKLGLRWNGCNGYNGHLNPRKYEELSVFCTKKHLKYYIDNSFKERSSDYRSQFFKHYPSVFHRFYFCSYCGRPVNKRKITIDHLYPVSKVRKSIKLQKKLKRRGIRDINDVKNLVPACEHCNKTKSAKMGSWIIRGAIGRYQYLWFLRHLIRITAIYLLLIKLIPILQQYTG